MFNPLIEKVSDLSDDDLMEKLNSLQKKLSQAASAGMFNSVNQIQVILQEYQEEMSRRHRAAIDEGKDKYDDLIDVKK
jgi:predicted transcriptional regulator